MSQPTIQALRQSIPGVQSGWGGPEYTSWQDEQLSWKSTCYIGDWSFLLDLELKGPGALQLLSDSSVNSYASFAIGQAKHIVQCNESGRVIVEGVVMRMNEDTFRLQSGPAPWTQFLLSKGSYDATAKRIETFQFQVSGPNALALCEQVAGQSLRDTKFMHFTELRIAGKQVCALRQGMAGEIGFELHGDQSDAAAVHAAVMQAGQVFGIRRLGRRTAMINHLEAAFPTGLWHYMNDMFSPETAGFGEFLGANWPAFGTPPTLAGSYEAGRVEDYTMSPYDLGWGKSVKFDHPFTGRAALEKEAAEGSRYQRVTLEFNADDVVDVYASLFREGAPYDYIDIPHPPRWICRADKVLKDGRIVGISSVPGYSLHFHKMLTLAYIDPALAPPGTQVEVVWGDPGHPQKHIRATIAPAPYKTDRRRDDLQRI